MPDPYYAVMDWETKRMVQVSAEEYWAFVSDPEKNPDHPVHGTPQSQDAYSAVLVRAKKAEAEVERLKREGVPGRIHDVDKAFYDLAIKERDYYKLRYFGVALNGS